MKRKTIPYATYCPWCDKTQIRCSDPPACIMGEDACSDSQAMANAENKIEAFREKVGQLRDEMINSASAGATGSGLVSDMDAAEIWGDIATEILEAVLGD